jgi:hypothetical protein
MVQQLATTAKGSAVLKRSTPPEGSAQRVVLGAEDLLDGTPRVGIAAVIEHHQFDAAMRHGVVASFRDADASSDHVAVHGGEVIARAEVGLARSMCMMVPRSSDARG